MNDLDHVKIWLVKFSIPAAIVVKAISYFSSNSEIEKYMYAFLFIGWLASYDMCSSYIKFISKERK